MASWIQRLMGSKSAVPAQTFATSFMHALGQPVWMRRDYGRFAQEAYARNVIAHRAIDLIATSAANVPVRLHEKRDGALRCVHEHAVLRLLAHPNPMQGGKALMQTLLSHRLIGGNAYLHAASPAGTPPLELHVLRPDRVSVIAGYGGVPRGYRYSVDQHHTDFPVDAISGQSRILHLKNFHPLDDWYGLSAVEAAAYSIDQHNQSGAWNQALLQNGARPTGALVVNVKDQGGHLSEEQYYRIKQQMDEQFSGAANAGRPLLLEGGLEWREMSHSPKDMDFIEAKHSAARDIALAFGVPPQLIGIPGDNTYANLAEARLALWEQTILPLLDDVIDALNHWLLPMFGEGLLLKAQVDEVPALTLRREKVWERVQNASFLSDDEKRRMVGVGECAA